MKNNKISQLLIAPRKSARQLLALVLAVTIALTLTSESLAQQRSVWASGGSKGIWAVMRNGMSEAGFKGNLRVRYQAGANAEASLRLLDKINEYPQDTSKKISKKSAARMPTGILLAAEPYYLRALIEQKAQTTSIPIVLIGADTGSRSQPKNVLAVVGIDAFTTGKRAAQYAIGQAKLRSLIAGQSPSLCLRTRSDDPARARICRGVASGLQKPVAMLNIARKAKGGRVAGGKSLNTKILKNYLKKNPLTPIIWLDDGAFTQELVDELRDAGGDAPQVPLVVFGLDVSQKNIIEQNPQKIAFVIDLKPFQQGKRAMQVLRDYLRSTNSQARATKTQIHSMTPKMLNSEEITKILPEIGRTR